MDDPHQRVRASIFVATVSARGEESYRWVQEWFLRWGGRVRIEYEAGSGHDFYWDVEAPAEAIAEIPEGVRSFSQWSQRPYPPAGERKNQRHGRR